MTFCEVIEFSTGYEFVTFYDTIKMNLEDYPCPQK